MEYKRIILAIFLSFMVFLLWDLFFPKPQPPVKTPVDSTDTTTEPPELADQTTPYRPTESPQEATPSSASDGQTPAVEKQPGRTITVKTPLYIAEISESGAAFTSIVLTGYRERVEKDAPLKQMISNRVSSGTGVFSFKQNSIPGLEHARYHAAVDKDVIEVADQVVSIPFTVQASNGIVVEKRLTFSSQTYLIECRLTVKNGSTQDVIDRPVFTLRNHLTGEGAIYGFEGPSGLINNDVERVKLKKIEKDLNYQGSIGWVANQDRYFMSALIPQSTSDATMLLDYSDGKIVSNQYIGSAMDISPGTQKSLDFHFFFGPKSLRVLNAYNNGLAAAVDFGMFDILAKPCLWLMNFIYDHLIANYGVAIIILTLITKILLWPLGTKSYKSMNDMKKLQPLVQQIREKHKNDKKKMNEETMALYRTYKINPLGGCLPMVVQIPVFFALYRMLYEAIELRHAPFLLWINDLSAPDRLFEFGFSIPFMEPPYGIPVLTIIMGASMLLQQKMSPPMGDPTQRKMMMLMPIVFTVIFINFSSGLVLYWFINNIVSIGQQYYISKKQS